jgi:SpoVK/Ycf46/Vps4 family AAA+-type ATPase
MKKNEENNVDEEFDLFLQKFIDDVSHCNDDDSDDDDTPDTSAHDDSESPQLPFPREMDSRVAEIRIKTCLEEHHNMEDVQSVSIAVMPGCKERLCCDGPMSVTIRMKPDARVRRYRFKCFVYNESFFPMCASTEDTPVKRLRDKRMAMELPCDHIWMPGKYILYVNDSFDESLMRVDFTLDSELRPEAQQQRLLEPYGLEHVLISCIEGADSDWHAVAEMPGVNQFRQRVMQSRQMVFFNEFRKELCHEVIRQNYNLLICTKNDDLTLEVLRSFQHLLDYEHSFNLVDCSTLYDPTSQYPYEQLSDKFSSTASQVYCLTHLGDLMTASGKVVMRRIMDSIRQLNKSNLLWLCGTRSEIDSLLELFPSLRQYFEADSYVEQECYSAFDLVQVFSRALADEHLETNAATLDRLSRTIVQGHGQGAIANWTVADVRRFVAEEVRPRFLRRALDMVGENELAVLSEEDIPFERLTSRGSLFEESIRELNGMVGLQTVKEGIRTMANQARFHQERRQRGLRSAGGTTYHMVFTGNPGTGKTTVARQLGKIYHSLGLLSKGDLIAVDRTRLVGQYLGQTEDNMKVVLEEARGNVLFIDEAYNLVTNDPDRKDFGHRVIESLLTVLTRPNPDMLVVLAGYAKEMDDMLSSNPGLRSRFPYRYQFEDYSADQLMQIAHHLFEAEDYTLTAEAETELCNVVNQTLRQKHQEFGNARWIEQLVRNGIIPAMADRVFATACTDFQRVEASDVTKAFERLRPQAAPLKSRRHVVAGFSA